MRICKVTVVVWFGLALTATGQRISFGIVGGTNITNHFPPDWSFYAVNPSSLFQHLNGPRSFILGASVEGRINDQFSIELNVLHRPMKSTRVYTVYGRFGATAVSREEHTDVRTWEFPVLVKYEFPRSWLAGPLRPFVEAGPSFRTQEDVSGAQPSQVGASFGLGAVYHWRRIRLAPTIRYTRWRGENVYPRFPTKPDQLEFLTSVSYEADFTPRSTGDRRLTLGVLAGYPVTRGFGRWLPGPVVPEAPERMKYMVGVAAEVRVMGKLSVEVDGIYKPLRAGRDANDPVRFSVLTWQFPVLAKCSLLKSKWSPFLEGGPSFRLAGNLNGYDPSHYGITAGGGVETRMRGLRLGPTVRFTHWKKDAAWGHLYYPRTNQNSVELIVGLSF